ncbi:MAG TPA: NAD(P)H-binding protein [Pseudonocardia sp.]|jgi:uncharacterized protein YbjT (DUF2867 family)
MKVTVLGATGRLGSHVVDILTARGHTVSRVARSLGVDVITGAGLDAALSGADRVIDAATGPSPVAEEAAEFFTTATRTVAASARREGVSRLIVASIIGIDRFTAGYNRGKRAHEDAVRDAGLSVRIVRAAQFHEFVEQLATWGRQGDTVSVPRMRTQLVAARSVAEYLVDVATAPPAEFDRAPAPGFDEIAGPREENLVDAVALLMSRSGGHVELREVVDSGDPDAELYAGGALLPGADAVLAGPSYKEWLDARPVPGAAR